MKRFLPVCEQSFPQGKISRSGMLKTRRAYIFQIGEFLRRWKNRGKISVDILLEKAKKPPANFQNKPEISAKLYGSYRENSILAVENSVEKVKNPVETPLFPPAVVENSVKKVKSFFCLVE